jgi:UDP-N-acetylmuramoyl-L-alanyl-D-glutamate--2,6-diaminopimelate ligase
MAAPLDGLLGDVHVLDVIGDAAGAAITDVVHDSRRVAPGALFCCVRGEHLDGHDLAGEAVAAGATALLVDHRVDVAAEVVQVVVADTRAAMGPIAAAFHGDPSRSLHVIGVTGTNGKTTVTHLVAAILEAHGWRCGVIGTLSGPRTTPEAPELQATLAGLRDEGCRAVAMEVSSHALALHRVDGTHFAVGVFTNLGRDHLDFHGTDEMYFRAKARLFDAGRSDHAVINGDDQRGQLLLDVVALPATAFSLQDATDLDVGATSSTFSWDGERIDLPLGGEFNVRNAIAAATTARVLGVPASTIAAGLRAVRPVPGRFEAVDAGQSFSVVVDYAHTPDGLRAVLDAARAATSGRVLVVFGCGGDRDHGKRPAMGAVATELADVALLTSDNPRGENPQTIIDEVRSGASGNARLIVEPDRRMAIATALAEAAPGDMVVIAGKGHETGQEIGDEILPFDDRVVAREELARQGNVSA